MPFPKSHILYLTAELIRDMDHLRLAIVTLLTKSRMFGGTLQVEEAVRAAGASVCLFPARKLGPVFAKQLPGVFIAPSRSLFRFSQPFRLAPTVVQLPVRSMQAHAPRDALLLTPHHFLT